MEMKNEDIIKDILTILDVRFYSECVGYFKVKIGEDVFEYDFELNVHIDEIIVIIDKKSGKEYDVEVLFEKAYLLFPEINKSEEFYNDFKGYFNNYFVSEIEIAIHKGMAKKLRNEAQIEFLGYKQAGRYFNIYSKMVIFEKEIPLHLTKTAYSTDTHCGDEDIREWFVNQLKINKTNKLTSKFYVDSQINKEFYGIFGILEEMIIQEFKDTKYFKMSILYDDAFKKIFE
jgi:hypothetical protein